MEERQGVVTIKGNPLTLLGNEVKVGEAAPDFVVIDNDLNEVEFSSYRGKTCIISAVPSLDTPVCDLETKVFNDEAANLGPNIVILTISSDLPFAQKRWCGAEGVDRVETLSSHMDMKFSDDYGVHDTEWRINQRSLFVLDSANVVQYAEYVHVMGDEVNFDAALEKARSLVG